MRSLERKLSDFAALRVPQLDQGAQPSCPDGTALNNCPPELYPVLDEQFLPTLSENFSRASHEGDYELALSSGRTLLALYAVLYPQNYPQIGEW